MPITNEKVEDGSIVVVSTKGFALSKVPYDPNIIGVIILKPAVAIKTDGQKTGYPVVTSGTVITKISGISGAIKKGDAITTSPIMGTGMKAVDSGFVLGEATNNINFAKSSDVKLVEVTVNPHYSQLNTSLGNSLADIFKLSKIAAFEKPTKALQYIVAAIIVLTSFGCGFIIFARAVNTGLEALGRNPLAGRMIQLSIVFNLILIAVIIVAGSALAYLVIRL